MAILTGILLLVIGLLACFFGKRLYRVVLALLGFVIGYYVVSGLLHGQSDIIVIVGSIIGGLIGAAIFWSLYKFAYIMFGLALGLSLAALIGNAFNLEGILLLIIAVVLGLIGAFVGNLLGDLIIRLSTAFAGASQAVGGLAALATAVGISLPLADPTHGGVDANSTAGIVTIIVVGVLGAVGYYFQTQNDTTAAV